jgi:uncharacterized protein (TIGR03000 family)
MKAMRNPFLRRPLLSAFLLTLTTAAAAWGQDRTGGAQRATLVVKIPDGAQLTVDGQRTSQTGQTRSFYSPPLEPGREFTYTFTAVIEPNNYTRITRVRNVTVRAGRQTDVDMTSNDPKQPDDIVIRYVPTPQPVVEEMLKLAGVGKGDVVYDLGCGDGRIVVTAVTKFGAKHAIGFDISNERIAESRANVKAAKVEDKVEIHQQDVLKIKDFSPASVVTLYMSDALDEAVRPDLQKTLKPGSRIVSHRFLMGDWKPEKTIPFEHDGETYLLHLWTIGKKP